MYTLKLHLEANLNKNCLFKHKGVFKQLFIAQRQLIGNHVLIKLFIIAPFFRLFYEQQQAKLSKPSSFCEPISSFCKSESRY